MATLVQQKVYRILGSIGFTRVAIHQNEDGRSFELSYVKNWKLIIYTVCHLNFIVKVSFVMLLSHGTFGPITEFFDWIAILLWFFIITMILTSERLFYRKYPFFEILCAGWAYQEALYQSLISDGEEFKKKLHSLIHSRIFLQTWIAVLGSAAMLFQYLAAPKYCVFTYSAIEQDTLPLYILFGGHELLFIFHGWQFYGGIIFVQSCFGAELILCIKSLTDVLHHLSENSNAPSYFEQKLFRNPNKGSSHSQGFVSRARGEIFPFLEGDENESIIEEPESLQYTSLTRAQRLRNGLVKPLQDIMLEYRKLTIWTDRINDYASYSFLVIHGLAYCQMVSDVFVMIQLLRMPETDIVSVVFFAEDAGVMCDTVNEVCMYMLFKVFKSMSFVTAASDDYLLELRIQLKSNKLRGLERMYLRRFYRSLRKVQMKIGPSTIGPRMVGNSMMTLLNYYICAAMW